MVDATALAAPNEEGRFLLDTDASAVAIAGILHQEQQYNGKTILRPIVYGSKSLTKTQMKYGASKLEMYAVFYFIEKFHSYLAGREFTLRVDNQALSWLKTYSMDQAMIGRLIARLDQYHFKTIHRPRTQHRNVDGRQKDQRLRTSGEDCGNSTRSEQGIQLHASERLRRTPHGALYRQTWKIYPKPSRASTGSSSTTSSAVHFEKATKGRSNLRPVPEFHTMVPTGAMGNNSDFDRRRQTELYP